MEDAVEGDGVTSLGTGPGVSTPMDHSRVDGHTELEVYNPLTAEG